MADNRKLAAGILNLPASARQELAQRAQDMEREGVVGMLRKAGKEMYDNPIVNTAIGFTPVLGDVQAAGETMAALNRGAPWQETAGYAVGMLPFIPMVGKTVWHGSPKIFDEFNLNLAKEGGSRSARGEGLYFSESPDFASSFRAAGGEGGNFGLEAGPTQGIATLLAYKGKKGEELARKYYPKLENIDEQIAIAKKAIDENSGLYKVDLPDEQIAKMIDYDLPLSQQSESVREALLKVNDPYINEALTTNPVYNEAGDYWSHMGNTYGSKNEALQDVMPANIISGQRGEFKSPQEVSQRFYEAGIPGTQYAERGTRNYVVFSDEIPQILERNGQPVAQALREYKQQFPEGMLAKTEMFETGNPATFEYIRNTEKSPYMGEKFGQDIEPAGRYLSYKDPVVNMESMPSTWETGKVSFNNPLVVNFGESYGSPTNWKTMISKSFGGKTGKDLSKAVANAGYDGIVTVDKYGTSEIVDLSNFIGKQK